MQVTALAEVVMSSRRSDGGISLHDLQVSLSRVGLDELARAVASLRQRMNVQKNSGPNTDAPRWY